MTPEQFLDATGRDLVEFSHDCHGASIALVRAFGECRVARGFCEGVGGQHSWVVLGMDCYDPDAAVVDPTLWSYDPSVTGVWTGKAHERPHEPHGSGSIWQWGKPSSGNGDPIELTVPLSEGAEVFLSMLGPLDHAGWGVLSGAPVGGWPAAEIFGAMWDDERLSALVPVDIVGMLTDRNPMGLYLPGGEKVPA